MKIYTRTGDDGSTGLFGGSRVRKHHPRVEAYGAVDELNALLGLACREIEVAELRDRVLAIQSRLFDLGADLATPPGGAADAWLSRVPEDWSIELESGIDEMDLELAPLSNFILPGGCGASAQLHLARTVCRRAERRAVEALDSGEQISAPALAYLNRLGDWLFAAARLANARAGIPDQPWTAERSRS
jgi:cob(I)alamin adenosyltransferase